MTFVMVTCLSVVYSSNRICMNLTLIIYASLKYKTMSKTDQIQVSTVEYADSWGWAKWEENTPEREEEEKKRLE
jgi:hypothetical protein